MNNAAANFSLPQHRTYTVAIRTHYDEQKLNVLAPSTIDAINIAMELMLGDYEDCPAEGLAISAKVMQ